MPAKKQNLKKALDAAKGSSSNAFEQLQAQIDVLVKHLEGLTK